METDPASGHSLAIALTTTSAARAGVVYKMTGTDTYADTHFEYDTLSLITANVVLPGSAFTECSLWGKPCIEGAFNLHYLMSSGYMDQIILSISTGNAAFYFPDGSVKTIGEYDETIASGGLVHLSVKNQSVSDVPEPSSLVLLLGGAAGVAIGKARRRRGSRDA